MIIFDTETTSLDFTTGNICQLSYIKVSNYEEPFKIQCAKNFFFTVDYVEEGAQRVHGFSVDKLRELSGCKRFKDFADEIYNDFVCQDLLCGHNVSFDINFLIEEFDKAGYAAGNFLYKKRFCTMQEYTDILCLDWNDYYGSYKWPKLSEVVSYLNLDKKYLEDKTKEVFGLDENVDFHDARLDVVTTREIAKIYYELCDGLSFKDSYHLKFYFDNMIRLPKDSYYKSLIYTLGINEVCRYHFDEIFDMENRCINPNCLEGNPWMTGSSRRNITIAFDLFNGFKPEERESLTYLLGYSGEDTKYYIEALKLRFL